MVLFHVTDIDSKFFKSCFSTINRHNGVNKIIFGFQCFPSITKIYSMVLNHGLVDNIAYIPSCIEFIDAVNKLHHIFEFGNDIICPRSIDVLRQYKSGIDYVHKILDDSIGRVHNSYRYPIKYIQFNNRVQCFKLYFHKWY